MHHQCCLTEAEAFQSHVPVSGHLGPASLGVVLQQPLGEGFHLTAEQILTTSRAEGHDRGHWDFGPGSDPKVLCDPNWASLGFLVATIQSWAIVEFMLSSKTVFSLLWNGHTSWRVEHKHSITPKMKEMSETQVLSASWTRYDFSEMWQCTNWAESKKIRGHSSSMCTAEVKSKMNKRGLFQ